MRSGARNGISTASPPSPAPSTACASKSDWRRFLRFENIGPRIPSSDSVARKAKRSIDVSAIRWRVSCILRCYARESLKTLSVCERAPFVSQLVRVYDAPNKTSKPFHYVIADLASRSSGCGVGQCVLFTARLESHAAEIIAASREAGFARAIAARRRRYGDRDRPQSICKRPANRQAPDDPIGSRLNAVQSWQFAASCSGGSPCIALEG